MLLTKTAVGAKSSGMSRALRREFAGAVYHLVNPGDRREPIVLEPGQIARRLRAETTLTLAWIALRLEMGSWTHASKLLRATSMNPPRLGRASVENKD